MPYHHFGPMYLIDLHDYQSWSSFFGLFLTKIMLHKTTEFWNINFTVKKYNENLGKSHIPFTELPEHFLNGSRFSSEQSESLAIYCKHYKFSKFYFIFDRYKILITRLSHPNQTNYWEWIYTPFLDNQNASLNIQNPKWFLFVLFPGIWRKFLLKHDLS